MLCVCRMGASGAPNSIPAAYLCKSAEENRERGHLDLFPMCKFCWVLAPLHCRILTSALALHNISVSNTNRTTNSTSISLFLDASQPLWETDKVMGVKLAQKKNTVYRYMRDATFVNRACVCDVFNSLVQYDLVAPHVGIRRILLAVAGIKTWLKNTHTYAYTELAAPSLDLYRVYRNDATLRWMWVCWCGRRRQMNASKRDFRFQLTSMEFVITLQHLIMTKIRKKNIYMRGITMYVGEATKP